MRHAPYGVVFCHQRSFRALATNAPRLRGALVCRCSDLAYRRYGPDRSYACLLDHVTNCVNDGLIAGAAAVISRDMLTNGIAICTAASVYISKRTGEHSGSAKAALQSVVFGEGRLQLRALPVFRKALDRGDLFTVSLRCEHQTPAHGLSVHGYGTCATNTMFTANMAACQRKLFA